MIDDILFQDNTFLEQVPMGALGGEILGFSMDGSFFLFEQEPIVYTNKEIAYITIS